MIGLVYLVWAPLGPEPLREFLRSYRAHPAGAPHELVVVLNRPASPQPSTGSGAGGRGTEGTAVGHVEHGVSATGGNAHTALLTELRGVEHRLVELKRPVLDLPAYGLAALQLEHERLCLLNSYSTILVDGWLGVLTRALDEPGVGLVGASGSWESQAEWIRGKPVYWPYQLAFLPRARRHYPRFPNPHIRTTAFMLERALLLEMGLQHAVDKRATYLLESGPHSVTRQVQARGLRAVVAGRDGRAYDVEEWPRSATYRAGGQENLLVADNRTGDWGGASPRLRRRLSRDAWGSAAQSYNPRSMASMRSRVVGLLHRDTADRLSNVYFRAVTAWRLVSRQRSKFVSSYLAGLKGIEIGAASHNRFYLDALNVDRFASQDTVYKREERRMALRSARVDIVASGDDLPLDDNSYDFVFSSHVIEHFPDPLKALNEWVRVARRYVVVIAPHRDRTFDADRPLSNVEELLERHRSGFESTEDRHWSVWTCESFIEMCQRAGLSVIDHQDPDDKIGNGFTVVIDVSHSPLGLADLPA